MLLRGGVGGDGNIYILSLFLQRKEVFGLAIANIVSGVVGGIPATAALAR